MNAVEEMEMDDLLYDMEGMADYLRDVYYEHEVADDMDKACNTIAVLIKRLKAV